ncbi:MAG: hypothetical protein KatS3mg103_0277 [Phycisphaerales bacterium]|nr:MAG: hypothetical protein KatS3mg103_0277 [Phycisphaerales bacterium]
MRGAVGRRRRERVLPNRLGIVLGRAADGGVGAFGQQLGDALLQAVGVVGQDGHQARLIGRARLQPALGCGRAHGNQGHVHGRVGDGPGVHVGCLGLDGLGQQQGVALVGVHVPQDGVSQRGSAGEDGGGLALGLRAAADGAEHGQPGEVHLRVDAHVGEAGAPCAGRQGVEDRPERPGLGQALGVHVHQPVDVGGDPVLGQGGRMPARPSGLPGRTRVPTGCTRRPRRAARRSSRRARAFEPVHGTSASGLGGADAGSTAGPSRSVACAAGLVLWG